MIMLLMLALASSDAVAFGRGACGRLEGGVALPCGGANFEPASRTMCLAKRNFLHPLVEETVVEAYAALRKQHPTRTWQYGEMGWESGGKFAPHRTHQNGLSADFFVPVVGKSGKPETLFTAPWNLFGYRMDFGDDGKRDDQRIDFVALADHLVALEEAGKSRGVRIALVILHLPLQKILVEKAPSAAHFRFNARRAWVQHDEHYHVDFEIPARLRRPLSCK